MCLALTKDSQSLLAALKAKTEQITVYKVLFDFGKDGIFSEYKDFQWQNGLNISDSPESKPLVEEKMTKIKAYSWDELRELWEEWGTRHFRAQRCSKRNDIYQWLQEFPPKIRRAAALAIEVARWRYGPYPHQNNSSGSGVCVYYSRCTDCLFNDHLCHYGLAEEKYKFIVEKYTEAYEKLPAKWREQ